MSFLQSRVITRLKELFCIFRSKLGVDTHKNTVVGVCPPYTSYINCSKLVKLFYLLSIFSNIISIYTSCCNVILNAVDSALVYIGYSINKMLELDRMAVHLKKFVYIICSWKTIPSCKYSGKSSSLIRKCVRLVLCSWNHFVTLFSGKTCIPEGEVQIFQNPNTNITCDVFL